MENSVGEPLTLNVQQLLSGIIITQEVQESENNINLCAESN